MSEYRRQFNLEPLVKDEAEVTEGARVRATVRCDARPYALTCV